MLCGKQCTLTAQEDGELQFLVNDNDYKNNVGNYRVKIVDQNSSSNSLDRNSDSSSSRENRPSDLTGNWLEGTWEGRGVQTDGQTWTIKLTVSGDRYAIEYPSLRCQGGWDLVDKSSNKAKFVERLTSSRNCIETGNVLIEKVDEQQIKYSYSRYNTKSIEATAILQRTR